MKPHTFLKLALLALSIGLTGCGKSLSDRIADQARHCPIEVSDVGFISDITLSHDTLTYFVKVTNPEVDMTRISSLGSAVKRLLAPSIPRLFDDDSELWPQILEEQTTLRIIYQGRGDSVVIDYSPAELEAIANESHSDPLAPAGNVDPEQRLQDEILMSSAHLPVQMTEDMTMTDVKDDGSNVVFTVVVDEAVAGTDAMSRMRDDRVALHAEMASAFNDATADDVATLREVCTNARRGIVYRYVGSQSGDTVVIELTIPELTTTYKTE